MTMRWHDSFDNYSNSDLNVGVYSGFDGVSSAVRYGVGQSVLLAGFGGNPKRAFPSVALPFFFGFALSPSVQTMICKFWDGPTAQFTVEFVPGAGSAVVRVRAGDMGTLLGTSPEFYAAASSWHFLEIGATIHDSSGQVTVRVNDTVRLTLTTLDTKQSAVAQINAITWPVSNAHSIDDAYFCDNAGTVNNTFLGEIRHQCLRVTADGSVNAWTPSAGSRFQCVDETQNSMTDYIANATPGDAQLFVMSDITGTPISFPCLTVKASVLKDDSTSREVATRLKSGATSASGATFSSSASVDWTRDVHETDPNAAAPWAQASIDALEAGVITIT